MSSSARASRCRRATASRCRRATASRLAGAVLILGTPLLWVSPAHAEQVDTVAFAGGCGVVGGESRPDVTELSVAAAAEVIFVNRLGRRAVLHLDGEAEASVDPGDEVTVRFDAGAVAVTMEIDCLLGQITDAVTVQVLPEAVASPSPPPAPPGSPAPSDPRPTSPAADPPAPDPPAAGPPDAAEVVDSPGLGGSAASSPAAPRRPAPAAPSTAGGQATPPGPHTSRPRPRADGRVKSEDSTPGPPTSGGGASPLDRATVEASAALADSGSASLSGIGTPLPGNGPIGLLALVATVCVVGVSTGLIRAIIAQRADRTEWA